jgi:Choline/Carnitine o-acyltransferase
MPTVHMQAPIGLLSAQHRDSWSKDHAHLESLHALNNESFKWIETAQFAVCLDHRPVPKDIAGLASISY